jgi:ubiquinone biosynthesis protein UbiJ
MPKSAREFFTALAERGFEPLLRDAKGTYSFEVEGAGIWHMTVDDGRLTVREGKEPADCTIALSEDDLVAAARGERNLLTLAMQGRLEIRGDLQLAQAFHAMLRATSQASAGEEHPHA